VGRKEGGGKVVDFELVRGATDRPGLVSNKVRPDLLQVATGRWRAQKGPPLIFSGSPFEQLLRALELSCLH